MNRIKIYRKTLLCFFSAKYRAAPAVTITRASEIPIDNTVVIRAVINGESGIYSIHISPPTIIELNTTGDSKLSHGIS